MVTCETWHDIWLNEGFATYSEALWFEHQSGVPDPRALRIHMAARRPEFFDDTVYVYDISSVRRIFSGTYTYRKAAWVLHMPRGVVGTQTFFDILDAYRQRFEFLTATTDDFRTVASEVWGADLGWFFDQWIYGGGAPAYSLGRRELEIGEQRYLELSLEQTQDEDPFTMPLQVETVELGEERSYAVWNDARTQHFLIPVSAAVDDIDLDPDDWVLTRSVTAGAFVDGPPKVVAVSPASGSVLDAGAPLLMTVTFHEDVVIDGPHFTLRREDGTEHTLAVTYVAGSHTATLVSQQPLAAGAYEVVIEDTIVDTQSGLALDGETDGSSASTLLPSGDGVPGGDAVIKLGVLGIRYPTSRIRPAQ